MNWLVYPIEHFFQWTFKIFPILGMNFDYLISITLFIGVVVWISRMIKFQKDEVPNSKDNY